MHGHLLQEAMELVEHAGLYKRQPAKGGSSPGRKQKIVEKWNRKSWRGKGSGGARLSKGSISHIEEGIVFAVASTQGKLRKGTGRKDKGKGPKKGPVK